MKRALKILLPFVLIAAVFVVYYSGLPSAQSYKDIGGHWAEAKIIEWSGYGVITGSDGLFRPGDGLTRAEMCTIISRVAELGSPAEDEYSDLEEGQWYYDVMLRCVAAGVLQPENGALHPEKQLSRQEGLDMLLRALGAEEERGLELLTGHYIRDGAAHNFGYDEDFEIDDSLRDIKEGSLDPDAALSRAELVLMLDACRAEGYLEIK